MSHGFNDIFSEQRRKMVIEQLIPRGISDNNVLKIMEKVRRDEFVSLGEKARSYYDGPLPIGCGQTISQPYIVAYMTEMLKLTGKEKVLELGTGSGYQTAVLAELAEKIFTVELISDLAERAEDLLSGKFRYTNIKFKKGNGAEGWSDYAPYDRIIVTAAPEKFPEALFEQLAEGGIIIAPVGGYYQNIRKYEKKDGEILQTELIAVSFVPLITD